MAYIKNISHEEVLHLTDQISADKGQIVSKTLAQNDYVSVTLFAFSKDEEIATHDSTGDAMVLVREGTGQFTVDGKEYIIGSCKYRNEPIGVDEFELLKHYAEVFGKGEKYHYYIFSKSGFTKGLQTLGDKGEVNLVTLQNMYE